MSEKREDRVEEARDKMRWREPTDEEVLAASRDADRKKRQLLEAKKVVKALEKEVDTLSERQAFIDELAEAPDPEPYAIRAGEDEGKSFPAATYCMNASDWHMGERVRPENVGWRNEYTPEIAQERAEQFWRSQLTMLDAARSAWDIRQGILWLGGDLMTGYIHEEYEEENFLAPVEEALLVYDTFTSGIRFLLDRGDFEHLLIPTSNGNHDRTGKKIRIATYAKNSFGWMVYHFLRRKFADESRVTFQIANGYNNLVDVYGLRINYHHGDAIRYLGGIGGPAIPMNKRIGRIAASIPIRWEGTEKGAPHLYVQGHLHTTMFPRLSMYNGSLIGWNDFAEWLGLGYEDPMQSSFVVDAKHKLVSNFNPIIVTRPRK